MTTVPSFHSISQALSAKVHYVITIRASFKTIQINAWKFQSRREQQRYILLYNEHVTDV